MVRVVVTRKKLTGTVHAPPSKSQSIRAIFFGSLGRGKSTITNLLNSPDVDVMVQTCRMFGARIDVSGNTAEIFGVDGIPKTPDNIIDAGNSGLVLRFAAAMASLCDGYTVITGDDSIRRNRVVQPLLEGLSGLGAMAFSTRDNGHPPIVVKGRISRKDTKLSGEDSQPVSALLMAASFIEGDSKIIVSKPGEKPWIALTLSWFDRLGILYENFDFKKYIIVGKASYEGFEFAVPGDFSSAAYPIVAALITGSEIVIKDVDFKDPQGDKGLIDVLKRMGAIIENDTDTITVRKGGALHGMVVDINDIIDALPLMAVVGCFAEGETRITNGAIARYKESDRIAAIVTELKKMGADIVECQDGLIVRKSDLCGAVVSSHNDHRIAMALTIAGFIADKTTIVEGVECIDKSYPQFFIHMGIRREC